MRNAYALLGLSFIIVFGSAYFLFHKSAEAPTGTTTDTTNETTNKENNMSLSLTSSAFLDGEMIPAEYTCDGNNINPPLSIANVPEGTVSFVLVMDDPDIPQEVKDARGIEKFDHWAAYNIPTETREIEAGSELGGGLNGRGEPSYTGPCPPTEYEPTTHRYIFRLYALSSNISFIKAPTLDELESAIQSSVIEKAELVGIYTRVKN